MGLRPINDSWEAIAADYKPSTGHSVRYSRASILTVSVARDAAGHANVSVTSAYPHAAVENEPAIGGLFHN
jgi:hypothetical protein